MREWKNALVLAAAALLDLLRPSRNDPIDPERPRVLVVSTTALGDTLWAAPALETLRARFPAARIELLTSPIGASILRRDPHLDAIHVVRDRARAFADCLRLFRPLRRARFDTVLVFHVTQRPVFWLCHASGAARVIGWRDQNKGLDRLLTHPIEMAPDHHAVDRRLDLVAELGARPAAPRLSLYLDDGERDAAAAFLRRHDIDETTALVGLQPGANHRSRRWPADRFAAVGARLAAHDHVRVIVFGSPAERALVDQVAHAIPHAIPLTGEFGLREAAAVIERLGVLITNDTGPMHIASALATPLVVVFGAAPAESRPYNAASEVALITRDATSVLDPHADPRALSSITAAEVSAAAEAILARACRSPSTGFAPDTRSSRD